MNTLADLDAFLALARETVAADAASLVDAPTTPNAPADDPAAFLPAITGYAAVWYVPGDPSTVGTADDGAELRMIPGAFVGETGRGRVAAWHDHDAAKVLGWEADGTLRLAVDDIGLRFWLTPRDTARNRRIVDDVKTGLLTGASFSYRPEFITEARDGGHVVKELRQLRQLRLIEISLTDSPRTPGACCWMDTGNPDADGFDRLLATARNNERREARGVNPDRAAEAA